MKVIWMEQAYTALSDTIDYVRQEYGDKFADRIVKEENKTFPLHQS